MANDKYYGDGLGTPLFYGLDKYGNKLSASTSDDARLAPGSIYATSDSGEFYGYDGAKDLDSSFDAFNQGNQDGIGSYMKDFTSKYGDTIKLGSDIGSLGLGIASFMDAKKSNKLKRNLLNQQLAFNQDAFDTNKRITKSIREDLAKV